MRATAGQFILVHNHRHAHTHNKHTKSLNQSQTHAHIHTHTHTNTHGRTHWKRDRPLSLLNTLLEMPGVLDAIGKCERALYTAGNHKISSKKGVMTTVASKHVGKYTHAHLSLIHI